MLQDARSANEEIRPHLVFSQWDYAFTINSPVSSRYLRGEYRSPEGRVSAIETFAFALRLSDADLLENVTLITLDNAGVPVAVSVLF